MYFIYGEEEYLIASRIKKISKQYDIKNIVHFYSTDSVQMIINEINSISFFDNEKIIVINDHPVIKKNEEAKKIMHYLENVQDNIKIIFTLSSSRFSNSNKLIKLLINDNKVFMANKLRERDLGKKIKEITQDLGGEISITAAIHLSTILPNNLRLIITEIKKLILENESITIELIDKSIGKYKSDLIFAFSDAIVDGNKYSIMESYSDKIYSGVEPLEFISLLGSLFVLASQINIFKKLGYSLLETSKELNIHQYRINKTSSLLEYLGGQKVDELVIDLKDLDYGIKTGKIDKKYSIDKVILNIIK